MYQYGTLLYDLEMDPQEHTPVHDPAIEKRMEELLIKLMKEADAPKEQYERLGLF